MAVTDHMYTAAVIGMNLGKFKALPADLQKMMLEAAQEAKLASWDKAHEIEERAKDVIGKHVKEVTHPDRAAFRSAMQSVYKEYEAAVGRT